MDKLTIIFLLLLSFPSLAQTKQFDIPNVEAKVEQSKKLKTKHDDLRDNQIVSTATQTVAEGEGKKFKDKVRDIHARLIKIGGILRDAQKLAQALKIIDDILDYQGDIVGIVKDDPKLVVFAVNSQKLIVKRATNLSKFIGLIPLQYNDWNVISDTDRKDMIEHIITELRVIRGNAYGLKNQLKYASQYNYWSQLNPWQGYVNQDKRLVDEILNNTKF
jgi:hypothetical protein